MADGEYTVEHMRQEIQKRLNAPPQGWKQERPTWCPHQDCVFSRRSQDALCGGRLPKPEPHDGDENTHRLCIKAGEVFDLQVNKTDLGYFRWIFDALDGKKTSWLSRDAHPEDAPNLTPMNFDVFLRWLLRKNLLRAWKIIPKLPRRQKKAWTNT